MSEHNFCKIEISQDVSDLFIIIIIILFNKQSHRAPCWPVDYTERFLTYWIEFPYCHYTIKVPWNLKVPSLAAYSKLK